MLTCNPSGIPQVLKTYLKGFGTEIVEIDAPEGITDVNQLEKAIDNKTAAVLIQNPNFFGCIEDMEAISNIAHKYDALFIACVNPISLGVLKPPGEYNADIAVGEAQVLGNYLNYGGPYLGFFTVKKELLRKMPGRIAGETVDSNGKRCFVLTLQARNSTSGGRKRLPTSAPIRRFLHSGRVFIYAHWGKRV